MSASRCDATKVDTSDGDSLVRNFGKLTEYMAGVIAGPGRGVSAKLATTWLCGLQKEKNAIGKERQQ